MRTLIVVTSILAVAFVGVLVWAMMIRSELIITGDELSSVKARLETTTAELEETKDTLAKTDRELVSTKSELRSTSSELVNTRSELLSVISELSSANSELTSTRSRLSSIEIELTAARNDLESTKEKLVVARETLGGLGITLSESHQCYDVDLVDNINAVNPTWEQLRTFLSQDRTEEHTYIRDVYDCSQFSRDIHNNAEESGIRAAVVNVDWTDESTGHALNAFLTTDYGLVYIDCIGVDTVARVKVGKLYRAAELSNISMSNIRNDFWWDSLRSYYYIASGTGSEAMTSAIEIFW